jgi:hypothetical protein
MMLINLCQSSQFCMILFLINLMVLVFFWGGGGGPDGTCLFNIIALLDNIFIKIIFY